MFFSSETTFESFLINTQGTVEICLKNKDTACTNTACTYKMLVNELSLLGLGALSPLCQLINHDDKRVRRNAIMALGMMSVNGVCETMWTAV